MPPTVHWAARSRPGWTACGRLFSKLKQGTIVPHVDSFLNTECTAPWLTCDCAEHENARRAADTAPDITCGSCMQVMNGQLRKPPQLGAHARAELNVELEAAVVYCRQKAPHDAWNRGMWMLRYLLERSSLPKADCTRLIVLFGAPPFEAANGDPPWPLAPPCAPREHVNDLDRQGYCVWCGEPMPAPNDETNGKGL